MPYQTGKNKIVSYKVQSGLGSVASGSGGLGLRISEGSQGLRMAKALIESREIRRDGMRTRGRHGSRSVNGSYAVQLSVGELDTLLQAALRGTWVAEVAHTQAEFTSITTSTNVIAAASGNFLTQGYRVGDMVKLTNHDTVANNGKWFRVLGVSQFELTLPANSLTSNAVQDSEFSITKARTLIQGDPPVERYFTFDDYDQDIDVSFRYADVKVNRIELSTGPNDIIMCTVGLIGLDGEALETGSSPSLTSPTFTTTIPLVLADGTIRVNGVDFADLTAFSLVLDLGGEVPGVIAPNSPDVFLSPAMLRGSVSGLRKGNGFFAAFDAETQVDFFVVAREPESEPWDFVSFYVGNATYDGNEAQPGADGAMVETIPWSAGKDEAGGQRAATMLKVSTSAA